MNLVTPRICNVKYVSFYCPNDEYTFFLHEVLVYECYLEEIEENNINLKMIFNRKNNSALNKNFKRLGLEC